MEGGFFGGNLIWQVMAAYKGLKREDNSLVNCKIWIIGFLNEAQNPRQTRQLMIRHTETPFRCHLHHIAPLLGMLYHLLLWKESKNGKSKKKKKKMLFSEACSTPHWGVVSSAFKISTNKYWPLAIQKLKLGKRYKGQFPKRKPNILIQGNLFCMINTFRPVCLC